jgi:hypothetical protein
VNHAEKSAPDHRDFSAGKAVAGFGGMNPPSPAVQMLKRQDVVAATETREDEN